MSEEPWTFTGMLGGRPIWFNRQGEPIRARDFEVLVGQQDYRRVGANYIGDFYISTIWVGLDQNMMDWDGGPSAPMIFESRVFYQGRWDIDTLHSELRDWDGHGDIYATEAAAIAGHNKLCQDLQLTLTKLELEHEIRDRPPRRDTGPPEA